MNLVVLDGFTLNPGDLTWDPLRALATCEIYDRTPPSEIVPRARHAEIVLTNKAPLTAATLAELPALRYIGVLATGHNVVDSAAARARGIPVTNVPAYGTRAVAQHVFALILELTNHVGRHARSTAAGAWSQSTDWCFWEKPLVELDGLVLGLVGCGRIGRAVADIARAFGLHVIVHSRRPVNGLENVSLDDLFHRSDIVSLHCPLTPENKGLVDATRLARMKPSALLINTARGPLIVDADLATALASGQLAGAALDVLSTEPPPADHPLITAPNCLLTPHLAWAARAARARLLDLATANLKAWQTGAPQNVVN